jgi:NADH-quinone oxidoreductase subunit G
VIRFSVDGRELEAVEGQTILEALDAAGVLMNGVSVPHYCWHPGLSIDGSCRLCQVEVEPSEGQSKLQIACDTLVRDGMIVRTATDRVSAAREGVLELLLLNHPLDCPICDQAGECKLQDYAFDFGAGRSRTSEPRRAAKKGARLGPTIVFDQERCILCRRCVRFCREITGTGELSVFERGDRSVIDTFPGVELDNPYSMNVADLCPVGALTTRDFRFRVRVWSLSEVPSVCSGCSRGCNLSMGVAKDRVHRYVPRRNDAVNDSWLCDEGRLSYAEVGAADRRTQPLARGADGVLEPYSYRDAIEAAAARLQRVIDSKGPGVVAGVASARATNEDLFTFKRLLDALGTEAAYVALRRGESDALLVQAEKAPNAAGARALGFAEAEQLVERIRGGGVDALIAVGSELLDPALLGSADALAGLDTVIAIDTHKSDLDLRAHAVLPSRHAAEQRGTFTNHAGRVQAIEPGVEPGWEAYEAGAVVAKLGAALGLAPFEGGYDVVAVSKAIGRSVEAFDGIDVTTVGAHGIVLGSAGGGR